MAQTVLNISPSHAEWLSTAETAQILGKSERTVQKMAKDGLLQWKPAGIREQPRQRVYLADDVRRIASGAPSQTFAHGKSLAVAARSGNTDALLGLFLANQKAEKDAERQREKDLLDDQRQRWEVELRRQDEARQRMDEEKQRTLKLERAWLTIEEAMAFSGLTKRQLINFAKSRTIVAMQEGGWRFNRASLQLTFSAVIPPAKLKARGARA